MKKILFLIFFTIGIVQAAYLDSVSINNWPSSFGRTWSLLNTTDSVNVGNFPSSFNIGNFPSTQAVTGTFWQATQPISAISLPLPSGASTAVEEELLFKFAYAVGGKATARMSVTNVITDVQADGLALQSTLLDVQIKTTDIQLKVNNGTYGLSAIQTDQAAIQSDITNNVEGAGFSNSTDSLQAISAYMRSNLFIGGRAV